MFFKERNRRHFIFTKRNSSHFQNVNSDITDVSQLQPGVLAKLVKTLLLRDKEVDMVRRNLRPGTADEGAKGGKAKRSGSAKKDSARKKSAKSPKRTPSAKVPLLAQYRNH